MTTNHSLFLGDLPRPEDVQFRARQMALYNWGTLSNLHIVDIPRDGLLITGPSGAGKSTILDAVSVMLTPPKHVRMNAAAQQANNREIDRNLLGYVRGAWSTSGDETQAEGRKEYLREGATWSALSLSFANECGRTLTLVRMFWVGGASAGAEVHKHYMVVDGEFDLAAECGEFNGDLRKFKAHLKRDGVRHHDTFDGYCENFCRAMGIDDVDALVLLHRTQSMKSLDSLDNFLRELMLARPETFDIAERLVTEFTDLDEAHRAVVAARRQIDLLAPARADYETRRQQLARHAELEGLRGAIDGFVATVEVGLTEQAIEQRTTRLQAVEGEVSQQEAECARWEDRKRDLEQRRAAAGGGDVHDLEQRIEEAIGRRETASSKRAKVALHARSLGLELAESPAEYAQQVAMARQVLLDATAAQVDRDDEKAALNVEKAELEREAGGYLQEVKRLEGASSNIPDRVQAIRDRLCEALKLSPARLPFVGELLQVKPEPDAAKWAGAIERLLNGFALSMIVPEADYKRVARWVDSNHLRGKLVYFRVPAETTRIAREPGPDSILDKLARKPHAVDGWLHRELVERYNYTCVDNAADLDKGDHRITIEGQIRHGRGRTEKDDRRAINDRAHWVLGFDSRDKLDLLRTRLSEASQRLADCRSQLTALSAESRADLLRSPAASALTETDWHEIDVVAKAAQVRALQARLDGLLGKNPELTAIEGALVQAREALAATNKALIEARAEIRTLEAEQAAYQARLQEARVKAGSVTRSQIEAMRARLPAGWSPILAECPQYARQLDHQFGEEMKLLMVGAAQLSGRITNAFREFLQAWPTEAGSLQATLDSAEDMFVKLARIEADGLPVHEARFRELLRTQSHQRLAELNRRLSHAKRDIEARLEDVNAALEAVDYHPGSYLRLYISDLKSTEVTDFRTRLAAQFAGQVAADNDPALAEAQFGELKALVDDLKVENASRPGWRDRVLDTRRHFGFFAIERERHTDIQVNRYAGSVGASGGQRQKLTTTCLAAALRYKLGGVDGGVAGFGMVALDEAFSGADHEFTQTCLEIFTHLGFQVVLATPLKSVMAIEPYVAGALHVSIKERNRTELLPIGYDHDTRRLRLTASLRRDIDRENA